MSLPSSKGRRPCSAPGCGGALKAKGMCVKHYFAERRRAQAVPAKPVRTIEERFWSKVRPDPSGCLVWTATKYQTGHGQFFVDKGSGKWRGVRAHRFAWAAKHGPIPPGLFVCHHCDNPPCVNVDHLYLGTHDDNMRDRAVRGRNGRRLTPDAVRAIKAALGTVPQSELARRFGVAHGTIGDISRGTIWSKLCAKTA